ncbi:metalloprotease 1 [Metarhizium guizhouense ARSEF 977]|uniref:Metalloprotease 1 n=1 Tax=Metarhizium guizhouense (strain ARSEF 977) TaxID=1276136 RepID=A0A0B4GB62_METGA|nr:metalloprotease 1 [Metarhizium guizhouense ARSEF 977]
MKILNKAYAPSNLTFEHHGTTWYQNATWAMEPDDFEKDYKTKLHRGTSRTLNLYFLPGLQSGGRCIFPNMNAYDGDALAMDGCIVGSFSLPGNKPPFNQGLTAVHEGGCDEKGGDFIADTPAEKSPSLFECLIGRDTCPDLPGLDPVQNYMDYSSQ